MVEYNPSPAIGPSYNAETSASSPQYDAGNSMSQGYNLSMDSATENNPFEMGGGYGNQGNQSSFQGSMSISYGMPSQTNNQPEFSGPVSVEESQCPTGGKCITCTYRCRMRKVS